MASRGPVTFMKYYPRSEEEEEITQNLWMKGHGGKCLDTYRCSHTLIHFLDFGSITVLWNQPVAGLQIMTPDRKWKWVKYIPNAVVGMH